MEEKILCMFSVYFQTCRTGAAYSPDINLSRDLWRTRPLRSLKDKKSFSELVGGVKYGVRSPKFFWAPCVKLFSLAESLRPRNYPPPPAFGLIYEGKIDDISL
jgi:hypothetical protein